MKKKLTVFVISLLMSFTIHATDINQDLLAVEIEGISLNTPFNAIPVVLEIHGYRQSASTTFIKRTQAGANRQSIHRIEITDTDSLRQISYVREKSGGRIKSPPKVEELIIESEIGTAQEIYRILCTEASDEVQAERICQPTSETHIIINQGNAVNIGSSLEVLLNASAASTTLRLKFSKE